MQKDKVTIKRIILRYLALFSGLFIMANGIVFTINANLGVNPWDVLHIGLANQTGLTVGRVMQLVGLILLVTSYFLKVRLYTGTILNMIFLGFFVDMILTAGYISPPELIWNKILLYTCGVVFFGFGVAVYISPNLGAGPRDSMMLALTRITGQKKGLIRTAMEATAATAGLVLGGPLGIGTIIFVLTIGFFMEAGFFVIDHFKRSRIFQHFWF